MSDAPLRFPFAPAGRLRFLLLPFGVTARTAWVEVGDEVVVRFGLWTLRTPTANVAAADETGPYALLKALGVRLSLADRGITFGTGVGPGVCVRFHRPVPATAPGRLLPHPGATVTVADPAALLTALRARTGVA